MDIVDAQIHMGLEGVEPILAEMNALGINAIMIDEFWGVSKSGDSNHFDPGCLLPNGVWRPMCPIAQLASLQHPDRFSYFLRVDRRDVELESLLRILKSTPQARAIRIMPVWTKEETVAFTEGAYDALFDLAQEIGLPVFVFISGQVELLVRYLKQFPKLTFIVDHCGMPFGPPGVDSIGYFDEVLKLAAHSNVALKWGHAQACFMAPDYPYQPLWPHLRRAINAFGAERIMWASDKTIIKDQTWADLLFCIRDNPDISSTEKEWILGRSLRTLLDWPIANQLD